MRSICDTWESPWGFAAESEPPLKDEMFPNDPDYPLQSLEYIEDFLQYNGVFSGPNGPAHMDSYRTTLDFYKFGKCLELLEETYNPTKDDWRRVAHSWAGNPNVGPMGRVAAGEIMRRHEIPKPPLNPEGWIEEPQPTEP